MIMMMISMICVRGSGAASCCMPLASVTLEKSYGSFTVSIMVGTDFG